MNNYYCGLRIEHLFGKGLYSCGMSNCSKEFIVAVVLVVLVLLVVLHCKKCGVTEHPRGAIFYCFHCNPYCYHGNSKILLPWGVQLHRVFYSVLTSFRGVRP